MHCIRTFTKVASLAAAVLVAQLAVVGAASAEIRGPWPEVFVDGNQVNSITFVQTGANVYQADLGTMVIQGALRDGGANFDFGILLKEGGTLGAAIGKGSLLFQQNQTQERWVGTYDIRDASSDAHGEASSVSQHQLVLRRKRIDEGEGGGSAGPGGEGGASGPGGSGGPGGPGGWGDGGWGGGSGGFTPGQFGKYWGKQHSRPRPYCPPSNQQTSPRQIEF